MPAKNNLEFKQHPSNSCEFQLNAKCRRINPLWPANQSSTTFDHCQTVCDDKYPVAPA